MLQRFIRSIREEAINWFIIFSYDHICNIVSKYMYYYNNYRIHQSLNDTPIGYTPMTNGRIKSIPLVYGLHRHYYREVA